jgi:hypothetical protein
MLSKADVKILLIDYDEELLNCFRIVENSDIIATLIIVEREDKKRNRSSFRCIFLSFWLQLLIVVVLFYFLKKV